MNRILLAIIFFAIALEVLGDNPNLETCESSVGQVEKAIVTDTKFKNGKYILKRGSEVGIKVTFTTKKKVKDLKAFADVVLNGRELSQALPKFNGCKILKCPLKKGGPYVYRIKMPILPFFPQIETVTTLRLKDENKNIIICVRVPIKII